jgi:hypothetical protein
VRAPFFDFEAALPGCGGRPGHRFFVGTLFVPQTSSRPDVPHPLISAYLAAAREPAEGGLLTGIDLQ